MKVIKLLAFALLASVSILGLTEGAFRLLNIGAPGDDPFLDISGDVSLYERVGDSYETRLDKRRLFRYERFDAIKPAGMKRVFCLGGSVVNGFPYGPDGAWPKLLETGLNSAEPGRWNVINAGGIAHASYRVLRIFKEVLEYEPDAIIVMSGHNEYLEKRIYSEQLNIDPMVKSLRTAMAKFHIFNALRHVISSAPAPEKAVLGEKVSWDYAVRDENQKKLTMDHYRYSLWQMAKLGKSAHVPVIFVTLPCNLKDYAPLGGDGTDPAGLAYKDGLQLLKDGKKAEAYAAFRKAADLDTHPVRIFSEYNTLIKQIASGSHLADVEKVVNEAAGGIPGNDFFLDHVHFTSEGAAIAAIEIAKALLEAGLVPQGDMKKVESSVATAQAALGPEEEARARYGAAYEAFRYLNRPEEARNLLEYAIKIYPNFPDAYQLLDELPRKRNVAIESAPDR